MRTPALTLRNDLHDLEPRPRIPTEREREREDRIRTLTRGLLARRGTHTVHLGDLATALGHCTGTLRRIFVDMDGLLADLLHHHLKALFDAVAATKAQGPDRYEKLRAAYPAATRTGYGGFTDGHLLLVRDRHLLPEADLAMIERLRTALGDMVAGERGAEALSLLDNLLFEGPQIEAMLAASERLPLKRPAAEAPPAQSTADTPPREATSPPDFSPPAVSAPSAAPPRFKPPPANAPKPRKISGLELDMMPLYDRFLMERAAAAAPD